MNQIKLFSLDQSSRLELFRAISNQTGIPPFAVEKDWWVIQCLAAVFSLPIKNQLLFKGGTSLSKAWKLIQRFSEDIDLAIDRSFFGYQGSLTKQQRTALRKTASAYSAGPLFEMLQNEFLSRGFQHLGFYMQESPHSDEDPRVIEVHYPNIVQSPGYLSSKVLIEIGCRSLKEPYSVQTFGSFIDEMYPDRPFSDQLIQVPTVTPERTFLEKVFLLHEEFQKSSEKIRSERMSRHLYDVFKLSKSQSVLNAINSRELYETIVQHRYEMTRISGIDYNKHHPQHIRILPPSEHEASWRRDYNRMREQMIYESNPPAYDALIEEILYVNSMINEVEWPFSLVF
jgi:predicted nucleotidyltransferase component of viral defense system